MITLTIRHTTLYRYRLPVWLGAHRLMLRPRESRELRLVSSDVTTTPAASLSWANDVFGNAVIAFLSRVLPVSGTPAHPPHELRPHHEGPAGEVQDIP